MRQIYWFIALVAGALGYKIWTSPEWQVAIESTALEIARPVAIPLIHLINAPAFIYVLSILLLVAGVVACVAYWMRIVRPRLRALENLRNAIRALPLPNKKEPQPAETGLRGLGAALTESGMFLTAWAALQTQVRREEAVPHTPFSAFARSDATVSEGEVRGLMASLPSYFTSVGLIFTFIGLVAALYFAARGFRSGDVEEARSSIMQLLNASSFKFLTSVAALASALLVSIVFRYAQSRLRHSVGETIQLIESYLAPWREASGPIATGRDSLDRKLDQLTVAIGALTDRVDQLLGALPDRKELRRDAAE